MTSPLPHAADNLIRANFALQAGERLALVLAPGRDALADAIEAAATLHEVETLRLPLPDEPTYELPDDHVATLHAVDAALISTRRSYTHTDGVRGAARAGTRIATNSDLTEAQLAAGLLADYDVVAERAAAYAARLEAAREVRLTSDDGTDLTFAVAGQRGMMETGRYHAPGQVGNLPAGEAACGIDDGVGDGTLVVNGSWPGLGLLDAPLVVHYEAGAIRAVEGPRAAELEAILERHGPGARCLAEFGIGMNDTVTLQGNTLLDEKVTGTVHVAVGNDVTFGGTNDVGYHADAVVVGPRLALDGEDVPLP